MQWLCKVYSVITYFFCSLSVPSWIFFVDKIRMMKMLKLIVNESIKTLLLGIKWLLMLSLHNNRSILCECWFKEKGIIQMFLSLVLVIIMCWLSKMSLNNVAFNYWYQKTLLVREVYHFKSSYLKTLANTAFTLVILVWFIFTMLGGECNVTL